MRAAGDDQDAVRLRDFFVVLRGRTAGRSCVAAGGLYGGDLQQALARPVSRLAVCDVRPTADLRNRADRQGADRPLAV